MFISLNESDAVIRQKLAQAVDKYRRGEIKVKRDENGKIIPSGGPSPVQRSDAERAKLRESVSGF